MLNSIESGRGETVILVHGMAASLHDWEAWMPRLTSSGYRSVAVDLLGHGDSPKPTDVRHYTIPGVYATFEDWIWGLNLKSPLNLISHSLGGYLSLEFSRKHPELVNKVVLINPFFKSDQLSPGLRLLRKTSAISTRLLDLAPFSLLQALVSLSPVYMKGFSPQARQQIAIDLKRASPQILNLARDVPDLTPRLLEITTPTLLIWSDRDRTLSPSSYPALAKRLQNVTIRRIERSGHQPHITHSDEVINLVMEYLTS